jgi:hypothetical protein
VAGSGAFIWTAANGVQRLSDVLTQDGIDLTGWRLLSANAISADGQVIWGAGAGPLGQGIWVAILPEPSSALLVSVGTLGLAAMQRRSPKGISETGGLHFGTLRRKI